MAAETWELDRDLTLAGARGDLSEVARLCAELDAARAACGQRGHLENPEIKGRCLKCGHGAPHPGPSICKASLDPPRKRHAS